MDPVTLAVVRGALEQIADEMDLHLIHAAISPIISETNDCAHGIFHPETGETIAQGRYGLPVFLANMQFTTQAVLARAKATGGFKPGDLWILNDPYVGGTHVQDIQMVAPVFVGGELVALAASTGHWMDVGGSVPGGNPFAEIGVSRASATLEATGMSIEGGVMKTRNLALVATPGQPLCGTCGSPLEVEAHGEVARTRCIGCGDRAEYRFPARAKQMAPGLVAAIGDELRVDRPDARLDATSAGMVVAVRCPSCGGGLDIPEGAHSARCTYCGTQCRIPSRTLLALRKSPGEAAPWWVLFRGPSALRDRLTRGGTVVEPDERESDAPAPQYARLKNGKVSLLPMLEAEHTPAENAIAWALQIAVPLVVLALVGVTMFGPVVLSWAQGRMSKETIPYVP